MYLSDILIFSVVDWVGLTGEGNGNPLQYSCLENPHGQESGRSLAGYSPWGRKSQTWLSDYTTATTTTKIRIEIFNIVFFWRLLKCTLLLILFEVHGRSRGMSFFLHTLSFLSGCSRFTMLRWFLLYNEENQLRCTDILSQWAPVLPTPPPKSSQSTELGSLRRAAAAR